MHVLQFIFPHNMNILTAEYKINIKILRHDIYLFEVAEGFCKHPQPNSNVSGPRSIIPFLLLVSQDFAKS